MEYQHFDQISIHQETEEKRRLPDTVNQGKLLFANLKFTQAPLILNVFLWRAQNIFLKR